ncbi:thiamine pyrophosphate-binding protein [Bartonella sp. W8122]|uniref:Acetolactate synthase-1/2/3 large subunit n=1 Tax=Bartonella apihabitans TaxID=2750929 RepID=A0A1U9MA11_9HYPH|nr:MULTISPECIES: thiamine pyrophosphate-binding protein [Bartonella]AQT42350.1 acetolactate synthase-1/2/3 large subunit [Bartonella apihabitans]MBI0001289.1 thiamine pyrophosphate-binding protein [Bartonella sp. W8122]
MSTENIKQGLKIQGGEAVARMLRAFHCGPMFGMGGFQLLPMYEAARKMNLQHFLINDERVAAFAADAYAKVSGRVGLADAALGPGATNLVTGLGEALNAGTPMVCIIGDTHRLHSWKNMTQEVRQNDILRPVCKELIRVEMIERIPELIRRAFSIATSGRPGPVVVDIPEEIMHDYYTFSPSDFEVDIANESIPALRCRPDKKAIEKAAALLMQAKRPLILAGGGVHLSGANEQLTKFVSATNIPVAHTLTGKGSIACTNRLNAGLFGRYDRIANKLIEEADVLFVIGCKLGEIATKRYTLLPKDKTIIHLDLVAEEFERTTDVDVKLWGDARCGLEDLLEAIGSGASALHQRLQLYSDEVIERMSNWRNEVSERLHSNERPINMARLMTELNNVLPEDAILVADGGFAAHWSGLLYDTKRAGRGFLPDRGFASIGYGLPGAIGAALAAPGKRVMALTGDSGFCMVIGDLETAKRLDLDITIIVVNNAASGYVKALQHLVYGAGHYHSSDLHEVDFASVANSFGCKGIRVEDPNEIHNALKTAMSTKGPVVIDVVVTRDPSKMLPGVDNRAATIKKGDRIA